MTEGANRGGTHFCPQCLEKISAELEVCAKCKLPRPPSGWPRDPSVGRLVQQKYRLLERLGSGGFAVVYRATQLQGELDLGQVALKFLRPQMAENESVRRRFINEARAARKVGSPHAVKVFDLGFDEEGVPFMAMEYLGGRSLEREVSQRGVLPAARVVEIGLQVAGALAECHGLGIIHRDLKPDNLILLEGQDGDFVKVLDFGIARVPDPDGTVTHTLMGTPQYMPPEQILQKKIDGGVDIFALGVILYECLTGRAPIPAETPMAYLQLNINSTPTPLRQVRPELSADLESLLGKMMAKDRDHRPTSMGDVALRLKAIRRSLEAGIPEGQETVSDLAAARDGTKAKIDSEAALAETVTLDDTDEPRGSSTRTMERRLAGGGAWRKYALVALGLLALGGMALRMARPGGGPSQGPDDPPRSAPPAPVSGQAAPSPATPRTSKIPAPIHLSQSDAAAPLVVQQPLAPDAGQPSAVSHQRSAGSDRPPAARVSRAVMKKPSGRRLARPRPPKPRRHEVVVPVASPVPAAGEKTEASTATPARVQGL